MNFPSKAVGLRDNVRSLDNQETLIVELLLRHIDKGIDAIDKTFCNVMYLRKNNPESALFFQYVSILLLLQPLKTAPKVVQCITF